MRSGLKTNVIQVASASAARTGSVCSRPKCVPFFPPSAVGVGVLVTGVPGVDCDGRVGVCLTLGRTVVEVGEGLTSCCEGEGTRLLLEEAVRVRVLDGERTNAVVDILCCGPEN